MGISFEELSHRVHGWVDKHKNVPDLQFACGLPYDAGTHERAAYLLLVAAINQQVKAEVVRDLMQAAYQQLGPDLLRLHHSSDALDPLLAQWSRNPRTARWDFLRSGEVKKCLLCTAEFLESTLQQGGLPEWSKQFREPQKLAKAVGEHVRFFGSPVGAQKKLWMYLRWMVRPSPDLQEWSHFTPAQLMVPCDVNTMRVFTGLMNARCVQERCSAEGIRFSSQPKPTAQDVQTATRIASWWFPEDPACVDYPFFLRGRELLRRDRER